MLHKHFYKICQIYNLYNCITRHAYSPYATQLAHSS